MNSGTYCLVLQLDRETSIRVGKLGLGVFPKGYYAYVGSALNGVQQRIARHLSAQKRRHWHIDYLIAYSRTIDTRRLLSRERMECSLSEKIGMISQGVPMKGFGSSDCLCSTHLYFFSETPLSNPWFETLWTPKVPCPI